MNLLLIFLVIILIIIGFFKAYKNTQNIALNYITLNHNKSSQTNTTQLNILHISDMHLEHISISPEQLYRKLKHESIDIITLTGDFLDRKRTIPKLIPYLKVFQKLQPIHGTYAIFGNHDYVLNEENFKKLKKTLEHYDCYTMQNENASIYVNGEKINIIGIDDFSTGRSQFKKSYDGLTDGYNLVLTHDPNAVLHMKDFDFDYLLSGHFHGGQILYPKAYHLTKMGKLPKMNMIKGLQSYQGKKFYISEGLGQTGVNIRIGSRPEITFHRISIPAVSKANAVS